MTKEAEKIGRRGVKSGFSRIMAAMFVREFAAAHIFSIAVALRLSLASLFRAAALTAQVVGGGLRMAVVFAFCVSTMTSALAHETTDAELHVHNVGDAYTGCLIGAHLAICFREKKRVKDGYTYCDAGNNWMDDHSGDDIKFIYSICDKMKEDFLKPKK